MKLFMERLKPSRFRPVRHAILQYSMRQPETPIHFRECSKLPIDNSKSIRAPIICLFDLDSPAAIFWTIRAIIIASIKGSVSRALSHVFKERLETQPPSITDGNATSSITAKMRATPSETPREHQRPDGVFRSPATSGSLAVSSKCAPNRLDLKAATAFGMPIPQMRAIDHNRHPAFTQARPFRPAAACVSAVFSSQPPKFLSRQGQCFRHSSE